MTEPKIAYVILHVIAVCGCKATVLELSLGSVTQCTACRQKWQIKAMTYVGATPDVKIEKVSDLIIPQ